MRKSDASKRANNNKEAETERERVTPPELEEIIKALQSLKNDAWRGHNNSRITEKYGNGMSS